jgi:predicted AAA+ superfamily ATPase
MVKREYYLEKLRQLRDMNVIKIITGIRRSGKSVLMEQFRHELKELGIDDKNIFFYNLEDKENKKFTKNPDLLHDTILGQIEKNKQNYVFIDEVQMIPEFEKTVDSLFVKSDIDLYITGSNAYMTSSEIATMLAGRYVEIKMRPLTFSEFMQFFPENSDSIAKFQQFMKYGGFPEVANFLVGGAEAQIPLYLQNIYETVLEKDIRKRKQIRSIDDFRNVVLYSFDNIGNITSPNKIAEILTNKTAVVDKATVDNYLNALTDCFILYETKRFDIRGKKLLKTLEKFYVVDLGLVDTVLGRPSNADVGRRLENIVFLELIKRYPKVWIGKNYEREIDFVIKNQDGVTEYFQVAQTVAETKTLEREMSAVKNTGDNYMKTILTLDLFKTDETGIECKNVIDWLLGR